MTQELKPHLLQRINNDIGDIETPNEAPSLQYSPEPYSLHGQSLAMLDTTGLIKVVKHSLFYSRTSFRYIQV